MIPSPQGRPLLIQAGASERARKLGRDPSAIKIIWGAQPIVAETAVEAQALERAGLERIPPEAGLHLMSSHFDLDLKQYDMDMPLERIETAGVQGILDAFKRSDRNLTLRKAARIYGRGIGMPHMVRTPQQVADQMESMLDRLVS